MLLSPWRQHVASPEPRLSPPSDGEAGRSSWLELQSEGMTSFLFEQQSQLHEVADLGVTLARDPELWLARLEATHDVAKFAADTALLEPVIRKLMRTADATTLSAVVSRYARSSRRRGRSARERPQQVSILRLLRDPPRLEPLVAKALSTAEARPRSSSTCSWSRRRGDARAPRGPVQPRDAGRARMLREVVRAIGPASLAPLTLALRGCLERGEHDGPLVDDLLRSIPAGPSDAAGSVVAEFLRSSSPETSATALYALASLWGDRARPLLFGALGHVSPIIVITAITALRALRSIDTHVASRLEAVFSCDRRRDGRGSRRGGRRARRCAARGAERRRGDRGASLRAAASDPVVDASSEREPRARRCARAFTPCPRRSQCRVDDPAARLIEPRRRASPSRGAPLAARLRTKAPAGQKLARHSASQAPRADGHRDPSGTYSSLPRQCRMQSATSTATVRASCPSGSGPPSATRARRRSRRGHRPPPSRPLDRRVKRGRTPSIRRSCTSSKRVVCRGFDSRRTRRARALRESRAGPTMVQFACSSSCKNLARHAALP